MKDKETFTIEWHCEYCQRDHQEIGVSGDTKELHLDCLCGAYYDVNFTNSFGEIWDNSPSELTQGPRKFTWEKVSTPGTKVEG